MATFQEKMELLIEKLKDFNKNELKKLADEYNLDFSDPKFIRNLAFKLVINNIDPPISHFDDTGESLRNSNTNEKDVFMNVKNILVEIENTNSKMNTEPFYNKKTVLTGFNTV